MAMNYESECPKCGSLNSIELMTWDDSPAYPCLCGVCEYFFWVRRTSDESETIIISKNQYEGKVEIPPLDLETNVYIKNMEHEFFLERGVIVKKDHKHYRIKFVSQNKKINNKCVWVPEHWVGEIPTELSS